MPHIDDELWSLIQSRIENGDMSGRVETTLRPVKADEYTESDLYYAMYQFDIQGKAHFVAHRSNCNYLVLVMPTYHFLAWFIMPQNEVISTLTI